jgi:hypothetical protein
MIGSVGTLFFNYRLIVIPVFLLTLFVQWVIWIIVIKKYITNKLMGIAGIEYNNYKTIILHSLKIYIKYALILFLIVIVVSILIAIVLVFFALRSVDILNSFYDPAWLETYITEYADSIMESKLFTSFFGFVALLLSMLIFFKLLFIENVLLFKHENYKIKNIVKESYAIIKTDRLFFIVAYFGSHLLLNYLNYLWGIYFKNNYVYVIFQSAVFVCLSMVYLIKFTEVKKKEYGIQ